MAYYVTDESGPTYTLLLEELTEDVMVDPINWLQLPAVVRHEQTESQIETELQSHGIKFKATAKPCAGQFFQQSFDRVESGDRVCRIGGICDRIFYNGETMAEPVFVANAEAVDIEHLVTPWDGRSTSSPPPFSSAQTPVNTPPSRGKPNLEFRGQFT